MPVVDLPVTILNDAELLDLARRVSAAIASSHAEHNWFGSIVEEVNSHIKEMNSVRNRQTGSELTDNIRIADERRDKAYLALRTGLEYRELSNDVNHATAAENLLQLLRRRDYSLHNLSDREQTVELNALLDDLSSSSAVNDLSTVGLATESEKMRLAQQAYVDLVDQRAAEQASRQLPSLRLVRRFLRDDLTTAVVSLNFAERRQPEEFTTLVESVSEHIVEVVANARARRTRHESDDVPHTGDLASVVV